MATWEYRTIEGAERHLDKLMGQCNELGRDGWEAFATVGIKKGITADAVAILLKRQTS